MTSSSTKSEFTIRSANQTLPLVRMIVEDIVQFSREISETRERLAYLNEGRDLSESKDDYSRELHSIENAMELKSARVDKCIRELVDLNVIPADPVNGFVDFPAIRENEPVHLCWNIGEKEVLNWHDVEEECSHRRPIDLALIRQSGEASNVE